MAMDNGKHSFEQRLDEVSRQWRAQRYPGPAPDFEPAAARPLLPWVAAFATRAVWAFGCRRNPPGLAAFPPHPHRPMPVTSPPDDDWSLLARARKDPAALAELFRRHRDSAWRFALARCGDPDLASDITQELFLRLAEYRRPVFRRAKFTTWLYRVTANLAVDEWRRQARARMMP